MNFCDTVGLMNNKFIGLGENWTVQEDLQTVLLNKLGNLQADFGPVSLEDPD